jgi:type VI secretion system protein ImpG
MDPRLLKRYNEELRFIREMGVEFAQRYPKIAGRLDLGENECADPYVERLLEGFAFLTARIQVKMDAEFPKFTQHLLEMVYPHYLAPTPSVAVVRFDPDLNGGVTEEGFKLPRHTELRSS